MNRALMVSTIAGLSLASTVAPAEGAATRAEYAAQVNPICVQTDREVITVSKKHSKGLKGLEKVDPDEELDPKQKRRLLRALGKVLKAQAAVEQRGVVQVAAIPPAPGDELLAAQFVSGLKSVNRVNRRLGELLIKLVKVIPEDLEEDEKPPKAFLKVFGKFLNLLFGSEELIARSDAVATEIGATKCTSTGRPASDREAAVTAARIAAD